MKLKIFLIGEVYIVFSSGTVITTPGVITTTVSIIYTLTYTNNFEPMMLISVTLILHLLKIMHSTFIVYILTKVVQTLTTIDAVHDVLGYPLLKKTQTRKMEDKQHW